MEGDGAWTVQFIDATFSIQLRQLRRYGEAAAQHNALASAATTATATLSAVDAADDSRKAAVVDAIIAHYADAERRDATFPIVRAWGALFMMHLCPARQQSIYDAALGRENPTYFTKYLRVVEQLLATADDADLLIAFVKKPWIKMSQLREVRLGFLARSGAVVRLFEKARDEQQMDATEEGRDSLNKAEWDKVKADVEKALAAEEEKEKEADADEDAEEKEEEEEHDNDADVQAEQGEADDAEEESERKASPRKRASPKKSALPKRQPSPIAEALLSPSSSFLSGRRTRRESKAIQLLTYDIPVSKPAMLKRKGTGDGSEDDNDDDDDEEQAEGKDEAEAISKPQSTKNAGQHVHKKMRVNMGAAAGEEKDTGNGDVWELTQAEFEREVEQRVASELDKRLAELLDREKRDYAKERARIDRERAQLEKERQQVEEERKRAAAVLDKRNELRSLESKIAAAKEELRGFESQRERVGAATTVRVAA